MPELKALAPQYEGKIAFFKSNVDEVHDIARKYGIMSIPTLKFFCEGRVVGELIGYMPGNLLNSELDTCLGI